MDKHNEDENFQVLSCGRNLVSCILCVSRYAPHCCIRSKL